MSNTTTAPASTTATTTINLDFIYSLFVNPPAAVKFYQIGYPITFLLGFIGNTLSLITFSSPALRKVSTGCLFMVLAISDTLFLLICVFDFVEFGLQVQFYHHVQYSDLCRFRSFVTNLTQFLSAWILVTVSLDRWIRTRFPYKSGSLCTPKKALIVVAVLIVIGVGIYAQLLTQLYGMLIPGFAMVACGPILYSGSYLLFYLLDWTIVQILIICLIPVALMVVILIDIFISVRIHKRAVIQATNNQQKDKKATQQRNLQAQMFILMLASICIFLTTTLPVAMYKITAARQSDLSLALVKVATIWIGLGWFQTLNFAVNFYIHCLTSNLFRKEFKKQIRYILGCGQTRVNAIELSATAIQTQTQAHHQ